MGKKIKVIAIVGPTGVGKTSISLRLAKEFNGEIISADSMQIYSHMNIGTAKITESEKCGITHHLLDIVSPTDNFSVAEWKNLAEEKIKQIVRNNRMPFIVGGTGLYVNALMNNFQFFHTDSTKETRAKYEKILQENGAHALYSLLKEKDAEFAESVDPKKTRAIIRYLEILESGNVDLKQKDNSSEFDCLLIGLNIERSELYKNINQRVDIMIDEGLENEITALIKNHGLQENMQSALAIGYREFWEYFKGNQTIDKTIELIKQHSRNYAKRQLTYMKKMNGIEWFDPRDYESIKQRIIEFIK